MKNYLYGIFAIAFLAFTACTNEELPTPGTGQDTPVEHKSGEILVKFSPYVSEILDKAAAATRSGGPPPPAGLLPAPPPARASFRSTRFSTSWAATRSNASSP